MSEHVIELSICEVPEVALRVGPTYRFYALEGCAECEARVLDYPGQALTERANPTKPETATPESESADE